MESLFEKSRQKVNYISSSFVRSMMEKIDWSNRLIGIRGARGVGKTTLLLQYMKLMLPHDHTVLYVSLDNLWFADNKLYNLTDMFVKRGGKYLLLDEVHKYPNWSQELKNLYDDFQELKVVFTGSSLLEILNARADISRRAVVYDMQGLSFREYLNYNLGTDFQTIRLDELLQSHNEYSDKITSQIKVFEHFDNYLQKGYYPFFKENRMVYFNRLSEIVNMILEIELPLLRGVDSSLVHKVKQLMQIVSESAPFIPNISKISERIGISRNSLLSYINALSESNLTIGLHKKASGISKLQKPDKLFLENTNLMYALSEENVQKGNLRETFFANQVKESHIIQFAEKGDFLVDGKHTFEIGGRGKDSKQIKDTDNSYIVSDDIEYGYQNRIPLWLFGFLY